ncbi:MAG: hypothetical protein KGO50_12750, partial [Myxococcales bacterium]|nr:hypothetical protein [Myxococcales bacterium]
IRFEKIEPNSRRLIERIQADRSWDRERSGIVPVVAVEEMVTAEGTADFEAIADELDSTFDSIFAAGPFSDAAATEGTNDTSAIPQYKTLLQRPGALDAALAGAEPHGGTPEWASTLGADFAPASTVEAAPASASAPEHEADALLAAFGLNRDAGTPPDSAATPESAEGEADPDGLPIGRIAFQKMPSQTPDRTADDDPGRLRSESSTRRPGKPTDPNEMTQRAHSNAWAAASTGGEPQSAPTSSDEEDLRSMLKRITSDHAAIFDAVHSARPTGGAALEDTSAPARAEEDLDALLGVSSSPAAHSAPPLPVLPTKLSTESSPKASDDAPLAAQETSAPATNDGSSQPAPGSALQSRPPQGVFARFFAWLRGLFGAK